ncbi:MAG: hypothetical protein AB1742_11355 [bacterium]
MKEKERGHKAPGAAGQGGAADRPACAAGTADRCRECGGELVDEEDYVFYRRLRRAAAYAPVGALVCAVWAPVFCLVRLALEGGGAGGGELAASAVLLIALKKIIVGAVLGLIIGLMTGFWGGDAGILLGAIAGVLGGFFVAATPQLPLRSEAEYRLDVVAVAMAGGVLSALTAHLVDAVGARRFSKWIGPGLRTEGKPAEGAG